MSTELARAVVTLEADISDFQAGMQLAAQEMDKAGNDLDNMGAQLSLKVTAPLVAMATLAVEQFGEEQDAIARVNGVLEATGGVAGTTTGAIIDMANSLQATTRYSNDAVIAASGLLLTFRNVRNELGAGNDIFNRTIKDAADLASVMGTDLSTAVRQLGRALEDPATGMMLLRRAGVQFTVDEREQIRLAMQHGEVLEAQRMILDKVESKTRDLSKVMAATPLGQFAQAWNEIKDAVKPTGEILTSVLVPLSHVVKELADAFRAAGPTITTIVVAVGAGLAALGPALLIWGQLQKVWAAISTVAEVSLLPTLGLVVAAIASLAAAGIAVVDNWEWIKVQAYSLWTAIRDAFFTGIEFILQKVADLGALADKIPTLARIVVPGLSAIVTIMTAVGHAAQGMHDRVAKAHEDMLASAGGELSALEADYQAVIDKMVEHMHAATAAAGAVGHTKRQNEQLAASLLAAEEKFKNATVAATALGEVLGPTFNTGAELANAMQTHIKEVADALAKANVPADQIARTIRTMADNWRLADLNAQLTLSAKTLNDASKEAAILGSVFGPTFIVAGEQAKALRSYIQEVVKEMVAAGASAEQIKARVQGLGREVEDLENKAKIGQFFIDQFGKAGDALIDFAFTGKQAFGDFVRSVLADLAKLLLRMEEMKLLESILGVGGGGGGGAQEGFFDNIPMFAAGGFLSSGKYGVVGENGPELVMAGSGGMTIAPISSSRGTAPDAAAAISPAVSVNVNVQAVDSRGVAQFFTENEPLVANAMLRAYQKSTALRKRFGGS